MATISTCNICIFLHVLSSTTCWKWLFGSDQKATRIQDRPLLLLQKMLKFETFGREETRCIHTEMSPIKQSNQPLDLLIRLFDNGDISSNVLFIIINNIMVLKYFLSGLLIYYLVSSLFFSNKMTIDVHSYTVDELASWLENKPLGASFIDVREASELEEQGIIKGYDTNIPYFLTNTNPELFEKKFSALDKDEQVFVVV